jgi:hypothetical protein
MLDGGRLRKRHSGAQRRRAAGQHGVAVIEQPAKVSLARLVRLKPDTTKRAPV